jgi:hypothetical protein
MQGTVELSSNFLNGVTRPSIITPNEHGEYPLLVGALNMANNKGEYYDARYARHFFEETSELVRMAVKNVLRAEYGHPNQGALSDPAYVQRLLRIDEQSVCASHRKLWLDFDNYHDDNGRPIIGIMSNVAPYGPYADALERALKNPREEVCFSIRCFSLPHRIGGRVIKEIRHIVTFDYVNEPGIKLATKYNTKGTTQATMESYRTHTFTEGDLREAAYRARTAPGSNESSAVPITQFMSLMGWEVKDSRSAKRNFSELLGRTA